MEAFKAQFAFNFGASALTVAACIDAVVEARGSIVLTSSVNGVTCIGPRGTCMRATHASCLPGLGFLRRNTQLPQR